MERNERMRKRSATTSTTEVEEKVSRRDGMGVYKSTGYNYKERQKAAMQRPKVFLTRNDLYRVNKAEEQSTSKKTEANPPQLLIRDLQYLLIYALRRGRNYNQPRWCNLLRPGKMSSTVMIVLNGVSVNDFQQHGDCFPFIQETFQQNLRVTMVNPSQYFSNFAFEMYSVPMTMSQFRGYRRKHGSTTHRNGVEVVFPTTTRTPAAENWENWDSYDQDKDRETVCRTHLTLSPYEMMLENYPCSESPQYAHFVRTKDDYAKITSKSPLFAVDCEMCLTSAFVHELARVSIYNEQGEKVYDELVKPYNPIVDHLTRFSGITKMMLEPVTKRLEDVQREIRELLPSDAILCGQSLGNDLNALQMFHPYVIDTSVIYNLSGCRKMKCSLKRLSHVFLGRVIQESSSGHSSAEDALATMDLVKLKLRKWFTFGDAAVGGNVMPFLPSDPIDTAQRQRVVTRSSRYSVVYGGLKSQRVQNQPPVMMRSLFDILCEEQVSACQVGGKKLLSTYREQPGLISCFATGDEAACEMAGDRAKSCKFTWVEFSPFSHQRAARQQWDHVEEAGAETSEAARHTRQRRKALKSVDQHVKKVVEQVWEKSLVIVVLTGNSKGSSSQEEPVAAFLHIT